MRLWPTKSLATNTLAELERDVTDEHVAAVEAFLRDYPVPQEPVAVIGLHGQTLWHRPEQQRTRQLCDGARAAKRLARTVVCDFRTADVLAGGQGAPLIPLFHASLAAHLAKPLMILNLGGVGNVTYLGRKDEIIAFDTGPANAPLDDFLRHRRGLTYDHEGALAASGQVHHDLIADWMTDPYFRRPPPKSLDRNHFHAQMAAANRLSDADGAATLTAFAVEAAASALNHVSERPSRWLVCGGGRHNASVMRGLVHRLAVLVEPIEAIGINGDFVEAAGFAHLALRSLHGLPISLPSTTGVPHPLTGGHIFPA